MRGTSLAPRRVCIPLRECFSGSVVGAAHDQRPSQNNETKESKNQSSTFPPDLHLSSARACRNPFRNSYALKATNNSQA